MNVCWASGDKGVARIVRRGVRSGTQVHEYKNINFFSINKFRLYFPGENRIISRSLRNFYKFPRSQKTQATLFAVFWMHWGYRHKKTDKMRELFIRNFQTLQISPKLRAPLKIWTTEERSTMGGRARSAVHWLRPSWPMISQALVQVIVEPVDISHITRLQIHLHQQMSSQHDQGHNCPNQILPLSPLAGDATVIS